MSEQTDQQTNLSGYTQTYLSPEPAYPVHTPEFIDPQTNLPMVRPHAAKEAPCPRCGYDNHVHSAECYACGSRLQQKFKQVRCRYCHTNTTNQLILCPSCGQELQAAPSPILKIATPILSVLLGLALLFGIWQIGDPLTWATQLWQTATTYVSQLSRDLEPKPPQISVSITPIQDIANMATLPVPSGNTEPIIPAIADGPSELTVADQIAANLAIVNQENAIVPAAPAKSPTPVALALSEPASTNPQEVPTATLAPIVFDFAGDEPAETAQEAIVQSGQPQNSQTQNSQTQNSQPFLTTPALPTAPPPVQNFSQPINAPVNDSVQAIAIASTATPIPIVPTLPPNPSPQNPAAQNQPAQNQPFQNQPIQEPPIQNPPTQNFNLPNQPQDQQPPQQPNPNPPINNQPISNEPSSFGTGGLAIAQPTPLPPTPVPPTPILPTPIPPTPVLPAYEPAVIDPNSSSSEPTLLPPGQILPTNTPWPPTVTVPPTNTPWPPTVTVPPTNTPWPTPTYIPPTSTTPPIAIEPTPIPAPPTPLPTPLPTPVQPTVAPQTVENPPTPVSVVPTPLPTPLPTVIPTAVPTSLPTAPPPVQPTVASRIVQNPVGDGGGDIRVGAANRRYRLMLAAPANGSVITGCDQPPILSWTVSRPLDNSHQYTVHIGYVDSSEGNVRWVMNQPFEATQDSWQLQDSLCNLSAAAEYGYQWRWYVEAIDKKSRAKVAPDTDVWGFVWQ